LGRVESFEEGEAIGCAEGHEKGKIVGQKVGYEEGKTFGQAEAFEKREVDRRAEGRNEDGAISSQEEIEEGRVADGGRRGGHQGGQRD